MVQRNGTAERVARIEEQVKSITSHVKDMDKKIDNIHTDIKGSFVRIETFTPVQNIVYGAVRVFLGTFASGLVLGSSYFIYINNFT